MNNSEKKTMRIYLTLIFEWLSSCLQVDVVRSRAKFILENVDGSCEWTY